MAPFNIFGPILYHAQEEDSSCERVELHSKIIMRTRDDCKKITLNLNFGNLKNCLESCVVWGYLDVFFFFFVTSDRIVSDDESLILKLSFRSFIYNREVKFMHCSSMSMNNGYLISTIKPFLFIFTINRSSVICVRKQNNFSQLLS